jgi:REP element-mobilizing transposase RayT
MKEAIASLLTWTTCGTWLRSDPRGYVGRTLLGAGQGVAPMHNKYDTPFDDDDGRAYSSDHDALKTPPANLSPDQALRAAEALCETAKRSRYELVRASAMANYVHVVATAHDDGKDEMFRRLKNVLAVRLTQRFCPPAVKGGKKSDGGRWWTHDGSKKELRDEGALAAAVDYVAKQEYKLVEIIDNCVVPIERANPPAKAEGS